MTNLIGNNMDTTWQNFLLGTGAVIEDGKVRHFGNLRQEIELAQNAAIVTDLSHFGMIRFAGEDSETFLQGQLTCDVRLATETHAQPGAYCTPKGRMLATFLLWRSDDGFLMQLPRELREPIQKRLGMYVLRSKVAISDASEATVRFGVAGDAGASAIGDLGGEPGAEDYAVARIGSIGVIRLPGKRFEIFLSPDVAPATWQKLTRQCAPVGADRWEWLDIREGLPTVTARTQEQFVPQMANLELIGGVSFKKGCYTGQEIVARSQYLGKVKRRMFLAHIAADLAPQPGDKLFGLGPEEQSGGMIVNAQPAPNGGYDALAVVLSSSVEAGDVHWNTPDGPVLTFGVLPYAID